MKQRPINPPLPNIISPPPQPRHRSKPEQSSSSSACNTHPKLTITSPPITCSDAENGSTKKRSASSTLDKPNPKKGTPTLRPLPTPPPSLLLSNGDLLPRCPRRIGRSISAPERKIVAATDSVTKTPNDQVRFGNITYMYTDTGEDICSGWVGKTKDPIKVLKIKLETMKVSHLAFLRVIEHRGDITICEDWDTSLGDWIAKEGRYDLIRNRRIKLSHFIIKEKVKDIIRLLLLGILHLKSNGLCFSAKVTKKNIVMIGDSPRFMGIGIRRLTTNDDSHRDLTHLSALIEDVLDIQNEGKGKCPDAMKRFIDILKDPKVNSKLLINHCSLMDAKGTFNFIQNVLNNTNFLAFGVYRTLEREVHQSLKGWQRVIKRNKGTVLYDVYNFNKKSYRDTPISHFRFLRNFSSHISVHSSWGTRFSFEDAEALLSSKFPKSVYLLQEILDKVGIDLAKYV